MLTIVRDALSGASPPIRAQIRLLSGFWLMVLALQIWDSRDGQGPAGVAEFLSAFLGLSGVGLLGLAHTLHLAMREAADRQDRPGDPDGVERVLLALPALGFAAGVGLGAAAILMPIRSMLGAEWQLTTLGFVAYTAMVAVAARTVMASVQTLFQHAVRHARAAGELRATAAAAQLSALQARMNPHFLFNALNTVASLIRTSPPAAERVVEDLADVLRRTLDRSATAFTTVADEVAYVRACLALERERWGSRLEVAWNVDPAATGCVVPPFIFQPLVENALRHGLGARLDGGRVSITVRATADRLSFVVEDDGEGFAAGWREGTGLGNLRQRLDAMFGGAAALEIGQASGGGRVTVSLPRRDSVPAAISAAAAGAPDARADR